jgi:hypothetical protein
VLLNEVIYNFVDLFPLGVVAEEESCREAHAVDDDKSCHIDRGYSTSSNYCLELDNYVSYTSLSKKGHKTLG